MIQIDMPMPDNCLECRFNTSEFGYCNAMPIEFVGQVSDSEEDGRPEWCPLKAQEPRVMTLEEAQSAYVIEYRSGKMREVGSRVLDLDVDPLNAKYGKIYRVWTSRPTDEQREKEPWNDAER